VRQQILDMLKTLFQNLKIFAFLIISRHNIKTNSSPSRHCISPSGCPIGWENARIGEECECSWQDVGSIEYPI